MGSPLSRDVGAGVPPAEPVPGAMKEGPTGSEPSPHLGGTSDGAPRGGGCEPVGLLWREVGAVRVQEGTEVGWCPAAWYLGLPGDLSQ